ncbi:MAG: hypothetical protein ABIJ34_08770 [archaeon]
MRYPTIKECLQWYVDQKTPDNIIKHVKVVRKVAVFLANELKKKGIKINIKAVDRAALLHDLDKWISLNNKSIVHGKETERILTEKGYPYLGFLAKQQRSDILEKPYKTWEEKIVSYADKRVQQETIVSIQQRIDYAIKRYNDISLEDRKKELEYVLEIEKQIFDLLGYKPDDFKNKLNKKTYSIMTSSTIISGPPL